MTKDPEYKQIINGGPACFGDSGGPVFKLVDLFLSSKEFVVICYGLHTGAGMNHLTTAGSVIFLIGYSDMFQEKKFVE